MPLPSVSDSILVRQLSAAVTAGWQLQHQPQLEPVVHYLLEAAPLRSRAGAFSQRAHDFLVMLDEALLDAATPANGADAFLTEEQSTGLRILFGTHPAYRVSTASVRRDNAAEYLGEPRRRSPGRVSGETLYKRRQRALLQLALDCFRLCHGQDPPGVPARTEIETVIAIVNFDELRRISNVFYHYRVRARFDQVEKLYVRAELPAGAAEDVAATGYTGVELRHIRQWIPGHLSVSLKPPHVLELGEKLNFGFRLTYLYPVDVLHSRGHFMHWEHNDYFRLSVHCHFIEPPELCWSFRDSLLEYPMPSAPNRIIILDGRGYAHLRETGTDSRTAHGVAWQW